MTVDASSISPVENKSVRGGAGSVFSRPLLGAHPGSPIAVLAVNRLPPGASIGLHSHHGEEDFYYCLEGRGIVTDNGVERPFHPGVFQITRSGESQALRNMGDTDLVFLGGLVKTLS
jgi:quercetin dioxygenase-like cupin family protein